MPDQQPALLTSSWKFVWELNKQDRDKVICPVRISVGSPRFWTGARQLPHVGLIAPYGLMQIKSDDEFAERYEARLEDKGVFAIQQRFEEIGAEYAGRPLVLLCFEDDPRHCHRSQFADWWKRNTGHEVPELTSAMVDTLHSASPSGD
jgi:hypothetical protein